MLRAEENEKLLPGHHNTGNGGPAFGSRSETRQKLDLWEAAKNGDIDRVEDLLKSGQNSANDRDSQNLTALHWAAIHRHTNIVRLLLDHGANPNAKGGDLLATPLMWAARSGILDVVSLLCKKGGNPNLYDSQGYNALHLAAHGAHYFMILYLVACQGMDLDSLDSMGRTSLMWLAYMGLSQDCLDQVLKLKPDINRQDSTGFTALHWAVCTAHWTMAQSLLKSGADTSIRDHNGKNVEDWAKEIKKEDEWRSALANARDRGGSGKLGVQPNTFRAILFSIPFIVLPLSIFTLSFFPWYIGLLAFAGLMWGMMQTVTGLLGKHAHKEIIKTPFPTAIFQASGYYVVFTWLFKLLPNTSPLTGMLFISLWSMAMYQLYMCIFGDPGFVPLSRGPEERRDTISQLLDANQFNEKFFCTTCEVKRPLRSKHCKICNRCVARFDHHCPWTYCCVGTLNHFRFVVFLIGFVSCVILFDILAVEYYSNLQYPADTPLPTYFKCNLSTSFCNMLATDSWTFMVAIWAGLQMFWCGPLCLYQLYYALFNTTTYESIKGQTAYPAVRNPYDKGPTQNVAEFVTQGRRWFETFPQNGADTPRERSIDLV